MNVFAGKGCKSCGVESLIPQFFGAVLGVFIGPKLIISGWSAPPGVFTQQTYSGSAAGWSPESVKPSFLSICLSSTEPLESIHILR